MPMPSIHSEPTAQVKVLTSSGHDVYHVTHWKGQRRDWECECAVFRATGRPCKHISVAKEALRSKQRPAGVVDIWRGLELNAK